MYGSGSVSFALVVFFLAMSLITRLSPRLNDGSWGVKFLALFALLVVAFLIPNGKWLQSVRRVARHTHAPA